MDLVDEHDQFLAVFGHFLQHVLDALLELAAIFRAGNQGVDVEFDQPLARKRFRHLAGDDPLGEPFHDRGLAHAGLPDQHRIVLPAPGENLDCRLDLLRATDHRIQLAVARELGQVTDILVEVGRVGGRLDPPVFRAAADDLGNLLANGLGCQPVALQDVGRYAFAFFRQTDEEVLRAHI